MDADDADPDHLNYLTSLSFSSKYYLCGNFMEHWYCWMNSYYQCTALLIIVLKVQVSDTTGEATKNSKLVLFKFDFRIF